MPKKENGIRQIKDVMYDLLQEPSREKFRDLLLSETGEKNNIDFKAEWVSADALSKIMLALGNSGGGIVVFGIKETTEKRNEPVGIEKIFDAAQVDDMIKKFVPASLKYELHKFEYTSSEYEKLIDKKFQVLEIEYTPERLPFISQSKSGKIDEDIIYTRRGTKCVKAKSEEIERILNKRIETEYSSTSELDLEQHINQLKILYKYIEKEKRILLKSNISEALSVLGSAISFGAQYESVDNANYPEEDFEEFIARIIADKKIKIQKVLDLK